MCAKMKWRVLRGSILNKMELVGTCYLCFRTLCFYADFSIIMIQMRIPTVNLPVYERPIHQNICVLQTYRDVCSGRRHDAILKTYSLYGSII